MDYQILLKERIVYIMNNCGSDAGERAKPGSKLETQINMICESVWELNNLLLDTEDVDAALNFARSLFYHAPDSAQLAFGNKAKAVRQ